MRVLITTDTVGGVWNYTTGLIAALAPHGVEFALAAMGGPLSPAQRRAAETLSNAVLLESDLKLEWMNDPWDDVRRAGEWLRAIEVRFSPDVVHLNGYAYGQRPFQAPVMIVAHSCCLSWWDAVKREAPPPFWNRYRQEVTAGLAGADAIVAPSRAMLDAVERWYAPAARTRVIYNGGRTIEPAAEKRPFIVSAGRLWDEAKNIAALATVAADVPWPIEVAGAAAGPDGIAVAPKHVRALGQLDTAALAGKMSRAAIYAMPARYEPFGLSILEAAFAGCALVLGDIPSLREIWGDAALFIDPNNPDDLRRALYALIDSPPALAALAARSQERAHRYSLSAFALNYLNEYERLSAQLRPQPAGQSTNVLETVA